MMTTLQATTAMGSHRSWRSNSGGVAPKPNRSSHSNLVLTNFTLFDEDEMLTIAQVQGCERPSTSKPSSSSKTALWSASSVSKVLKPFLRIHGLHARYPRYFRCFSPYLYLDLIPRKGSCPKTSELDKVLFPGLHTNVDSLTSLKGTSGSVTVATATDTLCGVTTPWGNFIVDPAAPTIILIFSSFEVNTDREVLTDSPFSTR
mmetsp:Transcript_3910/g.11698  ORF Transcript_3910/g.11698 Transcript_3910/m.11698 type:complete len:203 (-) Transcript_3910:778-1386(-)